MQRYNLFLIQQKYNHTFFQKQTTTQFLVEETPSFMMIRLPLDNRTGTIDLFRKHQPDHLVRKSHGRQGNHFVTALIYRLRKTIRGAEHKEESAGSLLFLFQPRS